MGNPYPSSIEKIAILNPAHIRFLFDTQNMNYKPVQQPQNWFMQSNMLDYILLNEKTFAYPALRTIEENPYPIPPLLAALDDIGLQKDMLNNFLFLIKKVGMMGFLQIMIDVPSKKSTENEEQYQARCETYITNAANEAEEGFASGVVVGFKDRHEFQYAANNPNVSGLEKAFEIVNKMLFNGLGTTGAFMGENNATTETFATVLLKMFAAHVADYQYIVSGILVNVYLTLAAIKGYKLDYVKVSFAPADVADKLKEAQTEQVNLANILTKLQNGLIDIDQAAREAGYEKAAINLVGAKKKTENGLDFSCNLAGHSQNCDCQKFDYQQITNNFETNLGDAFLEKEGNSYQKNIAKKYDKAVKKVIQESSKALKQALDKGQKISKEKLAVTVIEKLYEVWQTDFVDKISATVEEKVGNVYKKSRADKSIFPKQKQAQNANSKANTNTNANTSFEGTINIPDPINDFLDIRLIEFLITSDKFYLGKFVTDADTIQKLTTWIKDWYVANEGEIGRSQTLDDFYDAFGAVLALEKYQIRRIIDTTMINARNYANVKYLHQAQVQTFRRSEVLDKLTCSRCRSIHGREFSVSVEVTKLEKMVGKPPEALAEQSPFAVSVPYEEFNKLSSAAMQELGIGSQALHPHCRGRLVGVVI